MKCSNCSAVIKPVVAIDIDGTLADYHGWFIKFSMDFLNHYPPMIDQYDGTSVFREWWKRLMGQTDATWREVKLAYRQGGQKRLQRPIDAYTPIHEFFERLEGLGVEIWITTTRPYLSLDRTDPDTRFWLDRYGVRYYGLLYDDDKYRVLADRVESERVVAILDDMHEMYDAAAHWFGTDVPILRGTDWNRGVWRANRVNTLNQAVTAIKARVMDWRESADRY